MKDLEYVIVLLKNGRHKEEARNELNVFLGDDTDCFVSWLWDHLGSNLNIYIQQREAIPDDVIKVSLASGEKAVKNDTCQLGSESDKVKSDKSRPRHRREWKGLVRDTNEQPHLRSVVVDTSHKEVVKHNKVDCKQPFFSPKSEVRRKRSQHDYQPTKTREDISKATIAAPRRLLQFAVRDAVAALRPSHFATEPSLKRLRSVVSTSLEDSLPGDCLTVKQSGARVSDAIVTVSRVVAEAANDVTKRKHSANVFDRLGHDSNGLVTLEKLEEMSADVTEQMEDKTFVDVMEVPTTYHQTNYSGLRARKLHGYNKMDFYPGSDYECYTNINVVAQVDLGGREEYVGKKGIRPLVRNKNVTKTAAERKPKALKGQDHPTSIPNASCNIMTGSMNMNTWKSPQYQDSVKVLKRDGCESAKNSGAVASMPCMPFMEKRNEPVTVENERVKSNTEIKKESQKIQSVVPGLCSAYALLEDTDSRTIFVNNVTTNQLNCNTLLA
ncbi:unnamed protein product [Cuscuta campestris]|uniref:PWI domain-containing protein n=1 Tax=Cuscuta campestris TaxID=132261 RepID=A0A484NIC4_9ASTE|nr:unnamed protein product [Cuscuta campestris]